MKKLWNKELPTWLNCLHLFCRVFQTAVIGYFIYQLFQTISAGQTLENPILYFFAFIIPGQIYNRFAVRNGLKANPSALKQHDHIFLHSVLLAIGIISLFVTACVLYFVYKTK